MTDTKKADAIPLPDAELAADDIPRSDQLLKIDTFKQLIELNFKQRWLEARQVELLELIALCDDVEEQQIICDLLYRFHFVSAADLPQHISSFADFIVDNTGVDGENCVITAIARSSYSDSSQAVAWYLKPAFAKVPGWSMTNFVSSLGPAVSEVKDGGTIVLVDEFVGTGVTAKKAATWVGEKLAEAGKSARIVVAAMTAMQSGCDTISKSGIEFYARSVLSKGISDHFSDEELVNARDAMLRLEQKLNSESHGRRLKDMTFGYGKSESLYYLEGGNPPNNVFPIFWWSALKGDVPRNPLLERM